MIPLSQEKNLLYKITKEAKEKGVAYQYLEDREFSGRKVLLNGKEVLNFGNCSYLGLETHPDIKRGVIEATEKYGSLLSNSRAYFSSPLYAELEDYLDRIFPGYPVVTTTTTLGHCAVLPILIEENDEILLDQYVHNSVRMAASLCKANGTKITVVRHNNMEHLAEVVERKKKDGVRNTWYLADGIYSMQGDMLKRDELIELLDRHDQFYAYVDDAHGMSWQGINGAGYVLGNGEIHDRMVVAVSMCKSFGAFGGIIIFPNADWAERVRLLGQTLMFSAPVSPPILGAAIASARIHLSGDLESLQNELMDRIRYFRERCSREGIIVNTADDTPIQFIEVGSNSAVYDVVKKLMDRGVYVTIAAYPSMPKKHGGLRINITNHLRFEDIDYLIAQLKELVVDK